MPKEAAAGSSQGGLVYFKYTFRYRGEFDEPNDEWLNCIEATSDELLGACWGLVLKCYELRTRQHKMLNFNVLRPLNHYFPKDLMSFGRRP
jgi:hypothetical protein